MSVSISKYLQMSEGLTQEANDLAALGSIRDPSLPPRRHLVRAVGLKLAILPVEWREGVEVADQSNIISFHNATHCYGGCPEDSLRVQPHALQQGHFVFLVWKSSVTSAHKCK